MDKKIHAAQVALAALLAGEYPLMDGPHEVAKAVLKQVSPPSLHFLVVVVFLLLLLLVCCCCCYCCFCCCCCLATTSKV